MRQALTDGLTAPLVVLPHGGTPVTDGLTPIGVSAEVFRSLVLATELALVQGDGHVLPLPGTPDHPKSRFNSVQSAIQVRSMSTEPLAICSAVTSREYRPGPNVTVTLVDS